MSKRMIDSELIEALGTDIRFDGTGNVIVGKNLEVNGTTKLNGGIKPIHTFTWSMTQEGMKWDYTIESLYETMEGAMGYTIFNGYLRIYVNGVGAAQDYAIIGEYFSPDGNIIAEVSGIVFGGYPVSSITDGTDLQLFSYNSTTNKATFTNYALADKVQAKLYRHKITLNGIYVLMYNSTSNLNVGSVDNLRTIMKISASHEEILPVCASDATAMVTLVVTNSLCQVDGSDVTSVSDTVTPL